MVVYLNLYTLDILSCAAGQTATEDEGLSSSFMSMLVARYCWGDSMHKPVVFNFLHMHRQCKMKKKKSVRVNSLCIRLRQHED